MHQIEQEMKLLDGSQMISNLHNNLPTDPLTIAGKGLSSNQGIQSSVVSGQLVDWLPESMSIVINCKISLNPIDFNFFFIDPTSLEGRNLPDYPSFIFDLFEMVLDTFEMQKQYLSSSMTIIHLLIQLIANKGVKTSIFEIPLLFFLSGNPLSMESLYDRDDSRSVHCFPSEIYASRTTNNPYTSLKTRSYHSKQTPSRVHRIDSYEHKKISSHDEEKSSGLTNLRRKSLSSCDLFHVTSKTLTSPFDEIQNWLNNKRKYFIVYRNSCNNLWIFRSKYK